MSNSFRLGIVAAFLVLLMDQISKWWILLKIMQPPQVIPVTSFFNIVITWNQGISFGMFSDQGDAGTWIFSSLALIIIAGLVIWMRKQERKLISISLGLIIGGALGNVLDRINHNGVLDFLDFYVGTIHWPAFNVADTFISLGAIIIVVDSVFSFKSVSTNIEGSE
ncbi:MAG: signal peptidase II [Pseudomonadota bacterium]|nr:signal peptidase II [Pseudomonadota bacterium]